MSGGNAAMANEDLVIPADYRPLIESLGQLYISGDYSDLKISCKGKEWKVHKFCMCLQSDFFKARCSGKWNNGEENTVNLDDEEPEVVEAFLHYLYNFDYGEETTQQIEVAPLVLDVRMFAIADKYLVERLKNLASQKFAVRTQTEWNSSDFADAVAEVYAVTGKDHENNPLKQTVIDTVKKHQKKLLGNEAGDGQFLKMLRKTTEMGCDIAIALRTDAFMDDCESYRCPICQNIFAINKPMSGGMSCPRGCYNPVILSWWAQYKVKR